MALPDFEANILSLLEDSERMAKLREEHADLLGVPRPLLAPTLSHQPEQVVTNGPYMKAVIFSTDSFFKVNPNVDSGLRI